MFVREERLWRCCSLSCLFVRMLFVLGSANVVEVLFLSVCFGVCFACLLECDRVGVFFVVSVKMKTRSDEALRRDLHFDVARGVRAARSQGSLC